MIDGPTLRLRLDDVLRTDADLDAFCLDSFPEVHRRFSGQMERTAKINLLFQLVPDPDQIFDRLERHSAASSAHLAGVAGTGKSGEQRKAKVGSAASTRSTQREAEALNWRDPFAILKAAITAVPVMKYALAVAGLAAAVAIATRGFGLDPATATVGALIVIGLMAVLLVLAVAARQSTRLVLPAMALTWAVLIVLVSSSVLLLGSFFFSWPKSTPCLFQPAQCDPDWNRTPGHSVEGNAADKKPGPPGPAPSESAGPTRWTVAGRVRDARQEPLVGATVSLPQFDASTETNEHGHFQLSVGAEPSGPVLLRAEKRPTQPGGKRLYRPHETRVHLGSTELDLTLERE